MRKRWPALPPDVAAHVDKKLQSINWEPLLDDLMTGCTGCPARNDDRNPDPCLACPIHAVVWSAGRLWAAWKAQDQKSEIRAYYDSENTTSGSMTKPSTLDLVKAQSEKNTPKG